MDVIQRFLKSKNFWVSTFRDLLFGGVVVGAIALGLFAYAGVWPPLVSVDGTSMLPHMDGGDLVLLQHVDPSQIVTYGTAKPEGYETFSDYGDVIVYRPFGRTDIAPVIHRAMAYVNQSEPLWPGSVQAPNAGFVTRGDNNYLYDQSSGICPNTPVKPEWILGVARYRIPFLGNIRNLFSFFHL